MVGASSSLTDCVVDPTCAALNPVDNAPTGRRRRAILSKRIITRRDGDENAAGSEFKITYPNFGQKNPVLAIKFIPSRKDVVFLIWNETQFTIAARG